MADKGKFTLHYFNGTGRGEAIRWILAYSKVPFEDHRLSFQDWPNFKGQTPMGQLPVIEWTSADGKEKAMVCQSGGIIRHLARTFDLYGKTPMEQFRAEEAFEGLKDLQEALFRSYFEKDEAKKGQQMEQVKNEYAPRALGFLEKRLKENGGKTIAGGDSLTFADIYIASVLDWLATIPLVDLNAMCPGVVAYAKGIAETPDIKAYLAKRPKGDF